VFNIKTSFSSLKVWQIAFDYAIKVYKITGNFPVEENYALSSQLKRASLSIAANISEGKGRSSNKDFIRFLYIARGSLEESKSHLIFAKELGYVSESDFIAISKIAEEVGLTLNGLIKSLTKKL